MLNYKQYAEQRTDRNKAKTAALINRAKHSTGQAETKPTATATAIYNRFYWLYLNYFTSANEDDEHSKFDRIHKYLCAIITSPHNGNILYIRAAARRAAANDTNTPIL